MIELILKYEPVLRMGAFFGGFSLLALWERVKPRRELTQEKYKRWFNNFTLTVTNVIVVRLLIPTTAVGTAYLVDQNQWGISNYFDLPFWVRVITTLVLLDLSMYLQHVMFHVLPVLWRIHRVHHSDLDFDVTTGLRFHPVEIFISMIIKLFTIILFGAPLLAVILFEILLSVMSMFTHSNIYLNKTFERMMRWFIVTPEMHRVHHSAKENETNSNFSSFLSIWDRILGTYIAEPSVDHREMIIGLDQFRNDKWQRLPNLISMPFNTPVRGYAINQRDSIYADELEFTREIARQNQEKAMLASELDSYLKAIENFALVSATDKDGVIIQANKRFCEVSGYNEEELIGQNHRIIKSNTHPDSFFEKLWGTISSGQIWHGEVCDRARDGSLHWLDSAIVPIRDADGEIYRYVSVRVDITDQRRHKLKLQHAYNLLTNSNKQLEELSRVDSLTQIANRRHFDEALEYQIGKMRDLNAPLTLMLCDIDFFKHYNDNQGHHAGDECIQQVAQSIKSSFTRENDLVARYGGEEFAIILPNVNKEAASILAERIRVNVQNLNIANNASSKAKVITISVGVTTVIPNKKTTTSMLIERADGALYAAKANGRNNVQYYTS